MELHPCWKLFLIGISVFISFSIVTFSAKKHEISLRVILVFLSVCVTGFAATLIAGVHILKNSHIRRNLYAGKNKRFNERTNLISSNYDVEAAHPYCESVTDSLNSCWTESIPVPITPLNHVKNHPTPMPRKSFLVDEFMLMFLRLARAKHAISRSLSDSQVSDHSKKKASGRCRSQTWSSEDIEKQSSSADYKYKSLGSNELKDSFVLDMEDCEMYVKPKND